MIQTEWRKITYGNVAVKYEILPNDATPLLKAANTMIQANRSESTKGYSKFPSVSMPGVILRTVSLRKKKNSLTNANSKLIKFDTYFLLTKNKFRSEIEYFFH